MQLDPLAWFSGAMPACNHGAMEGLERTWRKLDQKELGEIEEDSESDEHSGSEAYSDSEDSVGESPFLCKYGAFEADTTLDSEERLERGHTDEKLKDVCLEDAKY